jgi:hypothetical protein
MIVVVISKEGGTTHVARTHHRQVARHDVTAGDWYTELLGIDPYFVRHLDETPAYVLGSLAPAEA